MSDYEDYEEEEDPVAEAMRVIEESREMARKSEKKTKRETKNTSPTPTNSRKAKRNCAKKTTNFEREHSSYDGNGDCLTQASKTRLDFITGKLKITKRISNLVPEARNLKSRFPTTLKNTFNDQRLFFSKYRPY